jgi:hypothetical protein
MHLLASLWAVVTASALRATLHWLPAVETAHSERRALAAQLREQIGAALNVMD